MTSIKVLEKKQAYIKSTEEKLGQLRTDLSNAEAGLSELNKQFEIAGELQDKCWVHVCVLENLNHKADTPGEDGLCRRNADADYFRAQKQYRSLGEKKLEAERRIENIKQDITYHERQVWKTTDEGKLIAETIKNYESGATVWAFFQFMVYFVALMLISPASAKAVEKTPIGCLLLLPFLLFGINMVFTAIKLTQLPEMFRTKDN